MTEIKIDPNTGLPELPEGYFFRVTSWDVQIRKTYPDTKWLTSDPRGNWDSYRVYSDKETRTVARGIEESKRTWRGRQKVTRTRNVKEFRFVNRSKLVYSARPTEEDGEITKKNLLELATNAYIKYAEMKENESIRGDYPPKKFEAV